MRPARHWYFSILLVAAACGSTAPLPPLASAFAPTPTPVAIAFDADGTRLLLAERGSDGRCSLLKVDAENKREPFAPLSFCPSTILRLSGGGVVTAGSGRSAWIDPQGKVNEVAGEVESARSPDDFVIKEAGGSFWITGSARVSIPVGLPHLSADGSFLVGTAPGRKGERLVVRMNRDGTFLDLTDGFPAIDSLDLSPDGQEVVFSAERPEGFDIGLVSAKGSDIHWIIPDPADERSVTWAPRGHKIGYLITTPGGLLFRTVHIVTGASLTTDLGGEEAGSLVWDPQAELVGIISESPARSAAVEVFRYGGKERHIVSPPGRTAKGEVETFAPHTFVVPPSPVRYSHGYPLVIWVGDQQPYRWSEARIELESGGSAGAIVTSLDADHLPAGFWSEIDRLPWVDHGRIYVVSMQKIQSLAGVSMAARIIAPTGAPPDPRVVAVSPDDVESTALRLLIPLVKPSTKNGLS